MAHDIRRILQGNKEEVDASIEKLIPRRPTKKQLERICGPAKYDYDVEAATKSIHDPVWDLLLRGGKRWRPALFLLFCDAFGAKREKIMDFTGVLEVVHNGTLMTDDVEDNSEVRRGKPAIHLIYGVDIAINAGNAMYFLPLKAFKANAKNFPPSTMLRAYEVYIEEMINLSYGQGFDIYWHRHPGKEISEKQYLQMCAYKTGTLARMSARLAALLAGRDEKTIKLAGDFAETIGIAFQIRDDILNLEGDEKAYGKEIGGDITEAKKTLIVIHALKHASPAQRKRLLEILGEHTRDQEKIMEAIRITREAGSIEYAQAHAAEMVKQAWRKFAETLKPSDAKDKLAAFTEYLIDREK